MNSRRMATRSLIALILIASAGVGVAALAVSAKRAAANSASMPSDVVSASFAFPDEPIAAEADVFRTQPAMLAIDPATGRLRGAHPRTLATYRALRAYPGAPPRIPHGLTPGEVLNGGCTTCHERGGYSRRFDAYVPVTPHPEMGMCLQCHVGDVKLMAIPLPGTDPSERCRQCHAAGSLRWRDSSTSWQSLPWPKLVHVADDAPPPIPRDHESRGNCVSCHAAPAAVEEIRTTHTDRASCRSCHVEATRDTDEYIRPQAIASSVKGGAL